MLLNTHFNMATPLKYIYQPRWEPKVHLCKKGKKWQWRVRKHFTSQRPKVSGAPKPPSSHTPTQTQHTCTRHPSQRQERGFEKPGDRARLALLDLDSRQVQQLSAPRTAQIKGHSLDPVVCSMAQNVLYFQIQQTRQPEFPHTGPCRPWRAPTYMCAGPGHHAQVTARLPCRHPSLYPAVPLCSRLWWWPRVVVNSPCPSPHPKAEHLGH